MSKPDIWHVLQQLTEELGEALGKTCEVVLHDFESPESSIVAISHGEISGRKIGDPTTNLGLPSFRNPYKSTSMFHYRTLTKTGRSIKSSSLLLKDDDGKTFAALCLNWDISQLQIATNILRELTATSDDTIDEVLSPDIHDVLTKVIEEAIASCNKPIQVLTRGEKRDIIEQLEDKGVFSVKHSVERVASALAISRVTVYGYLSEIRGHRDNHVV